MTYSISGTISPTAGGAGATVTLSGAASATTTTNPSGAYSFTGLGNGTYTVTPSLSGYSYSPSSATVTISGADQTANFTAGALTYTISGTISPTAGGSGATVTLSGAASAVTTANVSGVYTFMGLANGVYTVTPSLSGYTYTPSSAAVTISGANQTANFTAAPGGISVTSVTCNPDTVIPPAWSVCQVTISAPAPSGGTIVSLSASSSNVIEPLTLTIPAGANVSSFTATITAVTSNTTALITATLGSSSASYPLTLLPTPATGGLGIDVIVSQDSSGGSTVATPPFSTQFQNELLLAFVSAGRPSTTVTSVTGAGLSWVLVVRENAQKGTSEVWRAFTPSPLSNASVTATLSKSGFGSLTVMSFTGVDPSGANGSGAVGAVAVANAASALPSVNVLTSRDGSWVLAVGDDVASATSRTPGSGQNVIHQYLASDARTYWVQAQINTTPLSGTTVTINDTAPVATYNLSAVEVLPPVACVVVPVPQSRLFGISGGSSSATIADGMGCNWTASTDSPSWITIGGGSGTGNGSFTYSVSPSLGPSRMGTISVGGVLFKVLQQGTTSVFADVTSTTPNFDYINLTYYTGISGGCSSSPLDYCPSAGLSRGQMAAIVVSALDGINYAHGGLPVSYTLTPYFSDVPATNPLFPFIQRLADLHLADTCNSGTSPLFCPSQVETQDRMAELMILGWMHANNMSSFTYSTFPYFTDVPASSAYFSYIQKMRDMGFWMGCSASQYCPSNQVLNSDVAALVLRSLIGAP